MNDFLLPLAERRDNPPMPREQQQDREWLQVAQAIVIMGSLFLIGFFGAQALTDGLL